jgi:hypothetical protein
MIPRTFGVYAGVEDDEELAGRGQLINHEVVRQEDIAVEVGCVTDDGDDAQVNATSVDARGQVVAEVPSRVTGPGPWCGQCAWSS